MYRGCERGRGEGDWWVSCFMIDWYGICGVLVSACSFVFVVMVGVQ